ncbi:glycoside hydrolase family 3 N-terminal domain-containing protein [Myroides sp. LJL119]
MKKISLIILLCGSLGFAKQHNTYKVQQKDSTGITWVDSVYNTMSLDQKIGQLFMVAAYSNKGNDHLKSLENLVEKNHVGGVIFFQGGPKRQARMTNKLQGLSKIPLLVGIDGEWGLSMRLDSTYSFPYNMTLGAVQNMQLIQEMGKASAQQAKRLGLQFNFGPVVDVNMNPNNPIIGVRSFGETPELVAQRAVAYTKGYQSENIFATAKHFPGHGDTSSDSHYKLPVIDHDMQRLNQVELYPYKELIKNDLASVMVAHLNFPALEPNKEIPSSLSYEIVTKLLREQMGFEGLIFTDALNMKGATGNLKAGEVDLLAFKAGNDLLLFSENVPLGISKIKQAYEKGEISQERLAYSVKKILAYKYKTGLLTTPNIEIQNLVQDLNDPKYDQLNQDLYNQAITVIKNQGDILPLKGLEQQNIGYLQIGDPQEQGLFDDLSEFGSITKIKDSELDNLSKFTTVIIGYHKVDNPWRNHNYSAAHKAIIQKVAKQTNTILVSFAKAYSLESLGEMADLKSVIVAYQNNSFARQAASEVIFGAIGSLGRLPVSINSFYPVGSGISTENLRRLGKASALSQNMDPIQLSKIDSIVNYAIDNQFTPGAQVLVARNGKIIYNKSFGYHDYTQSQQVTNTDLYDLASLTKILATLPVLMKMYDQGKISMDTKLSVVLPEFADSDKGNITFKDLLTHQSGLPAWMPFYKATLDQDNKPDLSIYSYYLTNDYPTQVCENLFIKKDYSNQMLNRILNASLAKNKSYKYSDLGFIALKEFIERDYNKSLDLVVEDQIYKSLGANRLTYLPLQKFDLSEIPPTELDDYFRYTTIHGYVHDMAAAMQGGVAGHAGLFGTALDVAKVMQMYLNKGSYGQQNFFSTTTFDQFNQCVYCKKGNRRGIGFDKPQLPGTPGPTCNCASINSFGHTGFTGTMAWADPDQNLIYVFLSNRTYPNANVNLLSKENIRENIQQVIYSAILD